MAQATTRLTEMRVGQAIKRVCVPVVAANLAGTIVETSAFGILASLGSESLAAVGFGRNVFWWATSWLWAVGMAVMALVARAIGAEDPDRARRTYVQSLLSCFSITSVLSAIGIVTSGYTLSLLGASPSVAELGKPYLQSMFLSAPFMLNYFFGIFVLRALGEATLAFWLQTGIGLFQLLLTQLMVHGWGPVPAMGLLGGGLAFAFSRATGLFLVLCIFASGMSRMRLRLSDVSLKPDWPTIKTLFSVALPNSLEWLGADSQKMLLLKIIAGTSAGTFAVSAYAVGRQVEEVYGSVGMGFATAAGTLVGQNLGAEKPERAEESALQANRISTVIFIAMGALCIAFPHQIMGIFSKDAEVVSLGAWYLRMLGLISPFFSASQVFAGSLRGAADTRSPMQVALTCLWLIQLPLAYVLGLPQVGGLYGVYAGIGVFWIVQGLWLRKRFSHGRWKEISV